MTVFDVFESVPYEYLTISQSNIAGDVIANSESFTGVFKDKGGMVQSGDMEVAEASPKLHIRPSDFDIESCQELIGNGIRVNGQTYSIEGATAGTNFDTGVIEHYTLTLQPTNFSEAQNAL